MEFNSMEQFLNTDPKKHIKEIKTSERKSRGRQTVQSGRTYNNNTAHFDEFLRSSPDRNNDIYRGNCEVYRNTCHDVVDTIQYDDDEYIRATPTPRTCYTTEK